MSDTKDPGDMRKLRSRRSRSQFHFNVPRDSQQPAPEITRSQFFKSQALSIIQHQKIRLTTLSHSAGPRAPSNSSARHPFHHSAALLLMALRVIPHKFLAPRVTSSHGASFDRGLDRGRDTVGLEAQALRFGFESVAAAFLFVAGGVVADEFLAP